MHGDSATNFDPVFYCTYLDTLVSEVLGDCTLLPLGFLFKVKWAEQQKIIHRYKRDGLPIDPKFDQMWYLVSSFGCHVIFASNFTQEHKLFMAWGLTLLLVRPQQNKDTIHYGGNNVSYVAHPW